MIEVYALFRWMVDRVVDGVEHLVEDATEDSKKVEEALHRSLRQDLFEILLLAAWHQGVLSETTRAALEEELMRIDMAHLVDDIATAPEARPNEEIARRIRELTGGFSEKQRRYTLAAVERVLREAPVREGYREAQTRPTAKTLALFREALSDAVRSGSQEPTR
ncbi:MAG: hypothetical protein AAGE52_11115 [Myxococcota bacterium]